MNLSFITSRPGIHAFEIRFYIVCVLLSMSVCFRCYGKTYNGKVEINVFLIWVISCLFGFHRNVYSIVLFALYEFCSNREFGWLPPQDKGKYLKPMQKSSSQKP